MMSPLTFDLLTPVMNRAPVSFGKKGWESGKPSKPASPDFICKRQLGE